ncbi:hypothetical protein ACFWUQ_09185 [Streptomyces sp. NPDC058662]|uniref:hypothetical protein n=1 Tax=Streptomyces sp. NPDC058662 TaxID=3346583 RepID=UPI00366143EC
MGEISIERQHLDRLLADSASTYGAPYQRAFAELAEARRGRPVAEILPLLRRAAGEALLGFTVRTWASRRRPSVRASRTFCASRWPDSDIVADLRRGTSGGYCLARETVASECGRGGVRGSSEGFIPRRAILDLPG